MAAWHNHKVKVYDPTGGDPRPASPVYTIAGTSQGGAGATSGDGGLATRREVQPAPGLRPPPERQTCSPPTPATR